MGSKILKEIKETNKDLKDSIKDQKKEEKEAKKAYKEAKSDAGLFASKQDKKKLKEAKANYEKEKAETEQGKQLQLQGAKMEILVEENSRSFGVFHSDKKLDAVTKKNAQSYQTQATSFVNNSQAPEQKGLIARAGDKICEKIMNRILPDIPGVTDNIGSEKSSDGFSL